MPTARPLSVTIVLLEPYKRGPGLERVWNNLMALDLTIHEVRDYAGVIVGECKPEHVALIEGATGIATVHARPKEDLKPEPIFKMEPNGSIKPMPSGGREQREKRRDRDGNRERRRA